MALFHGTLIIVNLGTLINTFVTLNGELPLPVETFPITSVLG